MGHRHADRLLVGVFVHVMLLREAPPALFCSDLVESPQAVSRSAGTVQGFVCRWGAVPDEVSSGRALETVVTSVFVHSGWWHLLGNVLFLAAFTPRVEEDLGHLGVLGLFLLCATVGGVAHVLLDPGATAPSVGASGGVAGVLGAHFVLARGAQVRVLVGPVPVRLPSRFVISVWAGLQLLYTAVVLRRAQYRGSVSYEVHAVGFLVGLAVVALAVALRPELRRWRPQSPRDARQAPDL
jgi:membrane associated rhomboid family serine protease